MILSGLLRLITILKNSEQFGLQLLGPDYSAIKKIRWISFSISAIVILVGTLILKTYPASFDMFYQSDDVTFDQALNYSFVYIILILVAVIINCLAKLISIFINIKMKTLDSTQNVEIYTIEQQNSQNKIDKQKFAFSIDFVLVALLFIVAFLLSSFSKRSVRLYLIIPTQLTCVGVIVPLSIVLKNSKMKNILVEIWAQFIGKINRTSSSVLPIIINQNRANLHNEM